MQARAPTSKETGSIPRLVLAAARRFGDRSAIEDGDARLSFAELARAGLEASRAFLATGLEPGQRVALWAPNIHEWIVAAIGLQGIGGVLVPLNTRLKGAEAAYILRKSRARVLCTVGQFLGTDYAALLREALGGAGKGRLVDGLPELERIIVLRGEVSGNDRANGALSWREFLRLGKAVAAKEAERRWAAVSPHDVSDILFTSGTTGRPKGVVTTHAQNLRAFEAWSAIVGLREGDRYLIVNPFFHAFGYKAGWLSSLLRGATVLPHAVFDAEAVLARVAEDGVTVLPGPPALYRSFLMSPGRRRYDLSSLRLAVTGAAAIPVELVEQMHRDLGFGTVITGYGLTECCGVVCMCRADDDPQTIATTSGRAIPDIEVRCVSPAGAEVARGTPGEVLVRGYNVMQGYLDDAEATAATIDEAGWLHTGDIGVMDERGYLEITDRIKDMFIMGGFNCYPAEIESLMLDCDDVAEVAVVGVPDKRMGEVGMAFVVAVPGSEPSPESIRTWCRGHMANYKVPRYVELLAELPVNAMGKVTKFVLRERARNMRS